MMLCQAIVIILLAAFASAARPATDATAEALAVGRPVQLDACSAGGSRGTPSMTLEVAQVRMLVLVKQ